MSAQHCSHNNVLPTEDLNSESAQAQLKKVVGTCFPLSLEERIPGEDLQIQHFAASSAKAKTNLASALHLLCHMLYLSESCFSCRGGWIGRYGKKFIKITLVGSLCWPPSPF